jgi:hypothetical protein
MKTNINDVLNERNSTYGKFIDNANITNALYEIVEPWVQNEDPYIKEGIHMVLHKISRITCGDTKYKDNWVDIIGYSQCVLDILEQEEILNNA